MENQNQRTSDQHATGNTEPTVPHEVHLHPGYCVSIDKYTPIVTVCITHTKGKDPTDKNYVGGTIFVYHASSHVHIKKQVGLAASDKIWSKKAFEQRANQFGINFNGFLSYNVPFG